MRKYILENRTLDSKKNIFSQTGFSVLGAVFLKNNTLIFFDKLDRNTVTNSKFIRLRYTDQAQR
jgi:hypothetical protein